MKFDDIFTYIGEYGRYQKLVTFSISALVFANVFSNISTVFIGGGMDHLCRSADNVNCTDAGDCWATNRTTSLPQDDEETLLLDESQCRMYVNGNDTELSTCDYGWLYDRSQFKSTIVSEFDLVCEDSYKVSLTQSLYLGGFFVGSILFGFLCDYFGRKKIMFVGLALLLLFGVLTGLSTSYWFYAVSRFLCGIIDIGLAIVTYTYLTELVAPSRRATAVAVFNLYWSFGMMILTAVAYFIRSWDTLLFVNSISLSPLLLLYFFIPESPRWLLVKEKQEETKCVLQRIAEGNNVGDLPDDIFENLEIDTKPNENVTTKTNPLDIIRYPEMRKKTVCITYSWFAVNLGYYGLTYGVEGFNVDVYIGTFFGGLTELLAALATWFIIQKFGRRSSLAATLVSGGIACFINVWIPSQFVALQTAVAMFGKFFISAAFLIVYMYTAELFPTSIRSTGLGVCSFWSRVAAVLAPQIIFLEKIWAPLPLVTFSFTSVSAGILALFLPETLNFPLPQTIEEAEMFTRKSNRRRRNGDFKDSAL